MPGIPQPPGFSPPNKVFIRCAIAAVFFGLTILVRDGQDFCVKLYDMLCFCGSGICSLLFGFVFPYLLYTYSLTKNENGKASVMASVKPVVATLLGNLYFMKK